MDNAALATKLEEFGRGFEEFKAAHAAELLEVKKARVDPITVDKVDAIVADLVEMKKARDELERKINARTDGGSADQLAADEAREEFQGALKTKAAFAAWETKAVDADFSTNSTSGGVMIPETIAAEILKKVVDLSPMRGLVRVTPVSSPNYERLVDVNGTASGWAAEATTRSETGTPVVERVVFTHGELYAAPKSSNWALNDIVFDVAGWLVNRVGEEFAKQEGAAIISGNGTNKPTGFLAGTPVAIADDDALSPPRAFGVLQYKPTGAAASFQGDRLASPAGDPAGVFYDAKYGLRAEYRMRAQWLMNSLTLAAVMKFRNADGDYIFREGLTLGTPDTILGTPATIMEDMPALGANTFPVAIGDFNAGYELIDITGMSIIRDDVTAKGHTIFYVARRLGGKVTDDDAIKLIKCAAS